MTQTINLKVISSPGSNPVAGADVFLNGVSVGTTGSDGTVAFSSPSGGVEVAVQAEGYQYNTQVTSDTAFTVTLLAQTSAPLNITLNFFPAVPGITWNLLDINSDIVTSDTTPQSGVGQANGLTPGQYVVNANLAGYSNAQIPITVGPGTSFTITLVAQTDPTSSKITPASSAIVVTTAPLLSTPDTTEFIYPNNSHDKYFTATQGRIYIGNLFIDECYSIQWQLQDNTIPVFGYASRFNDGYAQGRSLVQGQFALNFVTEGYLYTVLQEYQDNMPVGPAAFTTNDQKAIQQMNDLYAQRAKLTATGMSQSDIAIQSINKMLSDLSKQASPSVIKAVNQNRKQQLNVSGIPKTSGYTNAVYQDVLFDIVIEFGDNEQKRIRRIESCKLISNEGVISPDGGVIMDVYGFVARRVR